LPLSKPSCCPLCGAVSAQTSTMKRTVIRGRTAPPFQKVAIGPNAPIGNEMTSLLAGLEFFRDDLRTKGLEISAELMDTVVSLVRREAAERDKKVTN
jgi:hypothetical protein